MNNFHDKEQRNSELDKEDMKDKPSQQEERLAQWTLQKYKESIVAKEKHVVKWRKFLDAYNGDFFKNTNRPDYKSDEVSNFIFSTVEAIRPIMADEDICFDVLPRNQEGLNKVDTVNKALVYEFEREGMRSKMLKDLLVCLQLGTSIFFIPWDANAGTDGNVKCILVNPFNFFQDPLAQDIQSCEYVQYASYKHVNQLKKLFPNKANLLEGSNIKYTELVANGEQNHNVDTQVLVIETWCRDYTYIDVEDEVNGVKVMKKKRAYPNGRVITTAPELSVVLSDKANPYKDGKFPFVLHKDHDIPFEFWGVGEIEQLLSPQKHINELTNQIIDNAKTTANTQWILDKNSGIGKGELTNMPGLIVRKNPGSEVRRDTPPSMPPYVSQMIEQLKQDIESISGVHDVTQGRRPVGIQAGNAILALQEAGQSRIRLKNKIMEDAYAEVAVMWFSRMKQFWVEDRWIRIKGEDGQPSFTPINRDMLGDDYDIKITSGSTMSKNKPALLDLMIRLMQTTAEDGLPVIDRETVLAYTPVPNKKEIVDKFKAISEGQQQAQLQQAQQQVEEQNQMFGEQLKQLNTAMQDVVKTVTELNGDVQKLEQEHEDIKQKDKEAQIENKGYEKGVNDIKVKFIEAMEAQTEQDRSFEFDEDSDMAGLTDADVGFEEDGEDMLTEEMLQMLQQMTDEELKELMAMYPELRELIMKELEGDAPMPQVAPQMPQMDNMGGMPPMGEGMPQMPLDDEMMAPAPMM